MHLCDDGHFDAELLAVGRAGQPRPHDERGGRLCHVIREMSKALQMPVSPAHLPIAIKPAGALRDGDNRGKIPRCRLPPLGRSQHEQAISMGVP